MRDRKMGVLIFLSPIFLSSLPCSSVLGIERMALFQNELFRAPNELRLLRRAKAHVS